MNDANRQIIEAPELRVMSRKRPVARECCGCPACQCGSNGPRVKTDCGS